MADTPIYEVYAIRYAEQKQRPEGITFLGGDHAKIIRGLDFFTYVIKGTSGIFVVDTGFNSDLSGEGDREFLVEPAAVLSRIGIEPKAVETVLLTHAHFDHVGNLDDFPNARFLIHAEEMASITGPDMTYAPFRLAYHKRDVKRLIELLYEDRLSFCTEPVSNVAPGIEFHLVGGHARGQLVLRVHTRRGWIVLASDAVHLYEEVETERPFAIFHDLGKMIAGYRTCLALAGGMEGLISGHDPKVTDWYPAIAPEFQGVVLDLGSMPKTGSRSA